MPLPIGGDLALGLGDEKSFRYRKKILEPNFQEGCK